MYCGHILETDFSLGKETRDDEILPQTSSESSIFATNIRLQTNFFLNKKEIIICRTGNQRFRDVDGV